MRGSQSKYMTSDARVRVRAGARGILKVRGRTRMRLGLGVGVGVGVGVGLGLGVGVGFEPGGGTSVYRPGGSKYGAAAHAAARPPHSPGDKMDG